VQTKTIHCCIFIEDINNFKLCFLQELYHSCREPGHFQTASPKFDITYSSSIIGITRPQIGTIAFPLNVQNVHHLVNTNRTISKIVSGRVVAIVKSLHFLQFYILEI
jgi:hypothetical protein